MLNFDYPEILENFTKYRISPREDSAAFLIWYLENYYRLDVDEAVDAVCDRPGDRGVDGIYVDDNDQTITIFQSRITKRSDKTVGESPLSKLKGTIEQFRTATGIEAIIEAIGDAQLAGLIESCELKSKINTHQLRGEYLSNLDLDSNGRAYLKSVPDITFVGKGTLQSTYISTDRQLPEHEKVSFNTIGYEPVVYIVDSETKAIIAPIKATELVTLSGISNQSLYAHNVRGPLGKTQVNRDIVESIGKPERHKVFPLFHNGITLIAKHLGLERGKLSVQDYFVVNGCQSLTALFNNRDKISSELRILTKFIQVEPNSDLAKKVTEYSNNQNGVRPRDSKSNHPIQIRLQTEIRSNYGGQYYFEIKRGDPVESGALVSNESSGLLMIAFDFKEPWTTHRKYQVFEDKHAALFGRPEVTADRIVLLETISNAVKVARASIENELFGKYVLTRYFLVYVVRIILERDPLFSQITKNPETFARDITARNRFRSCVEGILNEVIIDLNLEVGELGENFDYRGKLRDADWVKATARKLVGEHLKQIARKKAKSFSEQWTQ